MTSGRGRTLRRARALVHAAPIRARVHRLVERLKPLAGGVLARIEWARAVDGGATVEAASALVLAPHPDDETLGCGLAILRKVAAGTEVTVVVVSDGATWPPQRSPEENRRTRHQELLAAGRLLGLPARSVRQLDFPEGELTGRRAELVAAIAALVEELDPDEVYTTSPADPHPDHAALGVATAEAVHGTGVRVRCYPVWQWDRPRSWLRTASRGRRPVRLAGDHLLGSKRAAVAVYRSQISAAAGGELTGGYGLQPGELARFLGRGELYYPLAEPWARRLYTDVLAHPALHRALGLVSRLVGRADPRGPVGWLLGPVRARLRGRMTAGDVTAVTAALTAAGVHHGLAGRWGVDALLGRQTRQHDDVDVALADTAGLDQAIAALGRLGYQVERRARAAPPVLFPDLVCLAGPEGRRVELVSLDLGRLAEALGVTSRARELDARLWTVGTVDGLEVPCLSRDAEMILHRFEDNPMRPADQTALGLLAALEDG